MSHLWGPCKTWRMRRSTGSGLSPGSNWKLRSLNTRWPCPPWYTRLEENSGGINTRLQGVTQTHGAPRGYTDTRVYKGLHRQTGLHRATQGYDRQHEAIQRNVGLHRATTNLSRPVIPMFTNVNLASFRNHKVMM